MELVLSEQLARLANRIQAEVGITISIGLSHNKFLAKIASDLDKPRGMALIGKAETEDFLKGKPVGMLWGVGPALQQKLAQEGIRKVDDLLRSLLQSPFRHISLLVPCQ